MRPEGTQSITLAGGILARRVISGTQDELLELFQKCEVVVCPHWRLRVEALLREGFAYLPFDADLTVYTSIIRL